MHYAFADTQCELNKIRHWQHANDALVFQRKGAMHNTFAKTQCALHPFRCNRHNMCALVAHRKHQSNFNLCSVASYGAQSKKVKNTI